MIFMIIIVLVVAGGDGTPSRHCLGVPWQCPPNARLGACNELVTLSSVHLPSPICSWDGLQHCDVQWNIKERKTVRFYMGGTSGIIDSETPGQSDSFGDC